MFTVLLTTIIYGTWTTHSTDLDCNDAFECVGRSLNDTGHTAFNGYKSGFGPTTSWHGGTTICRAAFSCDSMAFLTSISGADEYIRCEGASSCANTTITTSYDCTCYGANSCVYAQISATETNAIVQCNADQSCSFAHINNTETVHGAGAYALYNAMIDTQGIDRSTFTIDLSADYAAYGATLICRSGHTCDIYCTGYTACFMFYVNCIGTCNFITRFNGKDTIAPVIDIGQFDPNPSIPILQDSMSIITRNEQFCNTQTTSLNSDNYQERRDVNITMDTEGPICCRGRDSCRSSVIRYQGITGQDTICSGYNACRYSEIYANRGNIFCHGRVACGNSFVVNSEIVYCTAVDSCTEASITKTSTIVCSGWDSCWLAIITSDGTDLNANFTGYNSAREANIYCNVGDVCNIACRGFESCLDTTLYCDGICAVQCDELSLCPDVITLDPTEATNDPTLQPSEPTDHPSLNPTQNPSASPTLYPSSNPTNHPSLIPTEVTESPSNPTHDPSSNPTQYPSSIPTQVTEHPTNPTHNPSLNPWQYTSSIDTSVSNDAIVTQLHNNKAKDPEMRDDSLSLVAIVVIGVVGCCIGLVLMFIFCYYYERRKRESVTAQTEIATSQSIVPVDTERIDDVIQDENGTVSGPADDNMLSVVVKEHSADETNQSEGQNMDERTVEGQDNKNSKTNACVTSGNDTDEDNADNIEPDEFIVRGDDDVITTF